jgi:signal transduction histidine kinase
VEGGLLLLAALTLLSWANYSNELHLLETQTQQTAVQLGEVVAASLRQSMLRNDHPLLAGLLSDIASRQAIDRAWVVDTDGRVVAEGGPRHAELSQADAGCISCHQRVTPPSEAVVLASNSERVRVAVPINNAPECAGCHAPADFHLGILEVDVPSQILWSHATQNLQMSLAISVVVTLFVTAMIYLMLHVLVAHRIEAFRQPLAQFASGNFGARLPTSNADEIGELALAFNRMADQLARHIREQEERSAVRQRAIVEERERIARELHDGLAQVLGYLNTKTTAVRLLLGKGQTQAAEAQLAQLEEAARDLFVDVREAILGLRLTSQRDAHLSTLLCDYADQFSQLSDLPVEVTIYPGVERIGLAAETELQLLRIVQEALANVRKHARASRACVSVQDSGQVLTLMVSDDGRGFDPGQTPHNRRPHFGLSTMRERAEAIGARFCLDSRPDAGTRITVQLEVKEN